MPLLPTVTKFPSKYYLSFNSITIILFPLEHGSKKSLLSLYELQYRIHLALYELYPIDSWVYVLLSSANITGPNY